MSSIRESLQQTVFTIGDTQTTLGTLLLVIAVLVVTFLLARIASRVVRYHFQKRHEPEAETFRMYGIAAKLVVWFVGVDLSLHLLGIHLNSVLAASGFLAVGVGFASKNIIENFLSGLILLWERTIRPGDVLIVADQWIAVRRIRTRVTEATTYEGEDILIPNALITQSTVKNLTRTNRHYRIDFQVGVAYESDQTVVRQTLEGIIENLDWRLSSESSWVKLVEFAESSVNYRIVVWIENVDDYVDRKADLLEAIWAAFEEKNITIAYPQLDVHFGKKDPGVETSDSPS